jgi:hypothetical protein
MFGLATATNLRMNSQWTIQAAIKKVDTLPKVGYFA